MNSNNDISLEEPILNHTLEKQVDAMYAPWLRKTHHTVYSIIRTLLAAIFLLPIRVVLFIILGWPMLCIAAIRAHLSRNREEITRFDHILDFIISFLTRALLFFSFSFYNIKIIDKRPEAENGTPFKAPIIICNHIGWIDIYITFSQFNGTFISLDKFKDMPFIGWLARSVKCIFISPSGSTTEAVSKRLHAISNCININCTGCNICKRKLIVFPEGTTTNGNHLLRFHTGIFRAGCSINPVTIQYPHQYFSPAWESISLPLSMIGMMCQFCNFCTMTILPQYNPSEEELANPELFCSNVQHVYEEELSLNTLNMQRKHKFVYHSYRNGDITAQQALSQGVELSNELDKPKLIRASRVFWSIDDDLDEIEIKEAA